MDTSEHYDWIIIGSGFGGSVSALRLAEKGYRVAVLEKGKRFREEDFAKTNWDLRRWLWMPQTGLKGIFQMSFFEHVTIFHGVGVGGGSLTYANTLPKPKSDFFRARSWSHLGEWERELAPHYETAKRMLGAATVPVTTRGDVILREIAKDMGREEHFHPTEVAVLFGEPGKRMPDPYFGGQGPDRVACTYCGACMTGCRVGAKNTLDKNYLYLAERLGAEVIAETEVTAVRPMANGQGYVVETKDSFGRSRVAYTADRVVFSGGVMGTIPLLLKMKEDPAGLPRLSEQLGRAVRTNSEALFGVVSPDGQDYSRGVAITSILHTDEHSHIEPVRYGAGSGFFRLLTLPHAPGTNAASRMAGAIRGLARHPVRWARAMTVPDYAKASQILLYMRTLEGTMRSPARAQRVDRLPEGPRLAPRRSLAGAQGVHGRGDRAGAPLRREGRRRGGDHVHRDPPRRPLDGAHPRRGVHGRERGRRRHRHRPPRLRLRRPLRRRRRRRQREPGREPLAHHHRPRRAGDEPRPRQGELKTSTNLPSRAPADPVPSAALSLVAGQSPRLLAPPCG